MSPEIESVEAVLDHAARRGSLAGVLIQGVDLSEHAEVICGCDVAGAVFLGCALPVAAQQHIIESGGLLFPTLPDLPYSPYRAGLYTPLELMEGYVEGRPESYRQTKDARIYAHYIEERDRPGKQHVMGALARRLHDHAIDDALEDLLHGTDERHIVAIMGGHGLARTDATYRTVVRLARELARAGYLVASGGGPGAMEATHLGAWLARQPPEAVDEALDLLAPAPTWTDGAWFDTALAVRRRWEMGAHSLAIPTWFYGHEPTNLFASHVAKYFSNSLREDGLLAIAHHGVIYAPGSAGTVQEIFQDACQNHYGTFSDVSPMIFLGRDFWTRTRPVYPLLQVLAAGRQYAELLTISDDIDEIVAFVKAHPPVGYRS